MTGEPTWLETAFPDPPRDGDQGPAQSGLRPIPGRAAADIGDPEALRRLADQVEGLDYDDAPLSAVADRVAAAIRLLRAKAEDLERDVPPPAADGEARERLLVASLYYLVTPVDLIPDFRAGGYIDDVLALSWIFGAAADVLDPYLDDDA